MELVVEVLGYALHGGARGDIEVGHEGPWGLNAGEGEFTTGAGVHPAAF